ncbi:hypothetical protein GH714_000838 [Hevea brasiliensis]|uniref:EGF-like domain-containing protein n=1 Tax=Hevea brasiliensis TaxID=3981 RepID=A0A6A6L8P4_HEVBR|nr:hypothetical protein GH714_000838 [Hevea brasiliensis]
MGFGRLLLQLVLVGALIAPATAQAKPGCPDRCGNVSIPYPFGTQGCSLNEDFLINCTKTDSEPPQQQAFLRTSNIEVTNISINGELQIKSWASQSCHNASTGEEDRIKSWLTLSHFTVSSSKNKFTVVGCDSYAYLRGFRQGKLYRAGCMSTCDSLDFVYNKSCAGSGCCQIEIPDGLHSVNVTARSFNNHTGILDFSPCTYAFIAEDDKFNFSSQYLKNIPQDKFPVILEWSIDNTTNKEASRRFSSACGHNAASYQPDNVPGYRCRCEEGYGGNPYLGCQDIDECNKGLHNCSHQCINLDGSYKCTCPKGYTEDGRNDGQRCTPHHFPYIILALGVSIGFLVLLVAISLDLLFIRQRRLKELKEKFFQKNGGLILQQKLSMQHEIPDIFKIFTAEELKEATNNYDDSTIVGRGGFGTVYKGILADNREVAIKKSMQEVEGSNCQVLAFNSWASWSCPPPDSLSVDGLGCDGGLTRDHAGD